MSELRPWALMLQLYWKSVWYVHAHILLHLSNLLRGILKKVRSE